MEVTVKTVNPHYSGFIRGVSFKNGEAIVPVEVAEALTEYGVTYEKPEQPKEEKPKRSPRNKKDGE